MKKTASPFAGWSRPRFVWVAGLCLVLASGCFPIGNQYGSESDSSSRSQASAESAGVLRAYSGNYAPDEAQARHCLNLVNNERARVGMPPLMRSRDLDQVAYRHALDLIAMGKLSHTSSDGRQLQNRLAHLGWTWAGENLARNKGFDDPSAEAVRGWIASPRHRDNMFRPDFSHCGMAVVRDPASGFLYIVQVFMIPVR